ncbi:hypothetical protein GCM10009765_17890 [Fodinicola feengrottensis]|uniref:Uncharacterized protein n=1 Tax=Fodinicola feengrottensis TaxID=435914 RepID=A0ABN2GD37_9ACTN
MPTITIAIINRPVARRPSRASERRLRCTRPSGPRLADRRLDRATLSRNARSAPASRPTRMPVTGVVAGAAWAAAMKVLLSPLGKLLTERRSADIAGAREVG